MTEYLTSAEVAEQLHVTSQVMLMWVRAGDLRASKVGRRWLFTQEDVDQFVVLRANVPSGRYSARRQRRRRAF